MDDRKGQAQDFDGFAAKAKACEEKEKAQRLEEASQGLKRGMVLRIGEERWKCIAKRPNGKATLKFMGLVKIRRA